MFFFLLLNKKCSLPLTKSDEKTHISADSPAYPKYRPINNTSISNCLLPDTDFLRRAHAGSRGTHLRKAGLPTKNHPDPLPFPDISSGQSNERPVIITVTSSSGIFTLFPIIRSMTSGTLRNTQDYKTLFVLLQIVNFNIIEKIPFID
jgi:hypothetical protein